MDMQDLALPRQLRLAWHVRKLIDTYEPVRWLDTLTQVM
jgi:hypothetical protein